jgi:hypothetical protein
MQEWVKIMINIPLLTPVVTGDFRGFRLQRYRVNPPTPFLHVTWNPFPGRAESVFTMGEGPRRYDTLVKV